MRRLALRDERGSLPMVVLVMMVGLATTAVLIPTMLTQDRTTTYTDTHMRSLSAAQAGVNVVVGKIRAATHAGAGDPSALPCASVANPLTGAVDSQGQMSYGASVRYFVVDPVANPTAAPMLCLPGTGTYDVATGSYVPRYAQITSTGVDSSFSGGSSSGASAARTIVTTYVVRTTNTNVAGGQLRIYPLGPSSGTAAYCMDTGSTIPRDGDQIAMQVCSTTTPVAAQQQFSYRSDLTLQLNTSITGAYSNGLCLATPVNTGQPADGDVVVLQACQALGSPPYNQQWSFNDSGAFQASIQSSPVTGNLSNLCMQVASQSAGRQVTLTGCDGNVSSTSQAWVPSPNVGDGAAAAPQLVNFQQFGRCADVTGQNVSADHMIAYPCKQNPLPSRVAWNQKFTFAATTGWLSTVYAGTEYCLFSPRTEGGWVRVTQCANPGWVNGVVASQLVWSSIGGVATIPYAQRYTFVDSSTDATRCLSIALPPASDNAPWDYVVTATCDGSTAQKWNADANLGAASLQNTLEK